MMKPAKKVGTALAAIESVVEGQPDKPTPRASMDKTRPQYRVMDEIARKRRLKHELDQLERDNYHEDPHANLMLSKKVPKFEEGKGGDKQDRRRSNVRVRVLNFAQLLDEDSKRTPPNYSTAAAPDPSVYHIPTRHFCGVCGLTGKYTCITCGSRFCSINCQGTHKETRCMKWIA